MQSSPGNWSSLAAILEVHFKFYNHITSQIWGNESDQHYRHHHDFGLNYLGWLSLDRLMKELKNKELKISRQFIRMQAICGFSILVLVIRTATERFDLRAADSTEQDCRGDRWPRPVGRSSSFGFFSTFSKSKFQVSPKKAKMMKQHPKKAKMMKQHPNYFA